MTVETLGLGPHASLGFEREMPGVSGDVTILSPGAEQYGLLTGRERESADRAVGSAKVVLGLLGHETAQEHPDWTPSERNVGVGYEVADLVMGTMGDGKSTAEDRVEANLVGLVWASEQPGDVPVATALHQADTDELGEALTTAVQGGVEEAKLANAVWAIEAVGKGNKVEKEARHTPEKLMRHTEDLEWGEDSMTLLRLRAAIEQGSGVEGQVNGLREFVELQDDLYRTRFRQDLSLTAREQMERTGGKFTNSHGEPLIFGEGPENGVAMQADKAYRVVDTRAVVDLIDSGIVRGAKTATGGARGTTEEDTTHWSDGVAGKRLGFNREGAFIIETDTMTLDEGCVTADKITGLYTRDHTGELINLLGDQDQEHRVPVSASEIYGKLASCPDDQKRLEMFASIFRQKGNLGYTFYEDGATELLAGMPTTQIEAILNSTYSEQVKGLVEEMSYQIIVDENLRAHENAIRALEYIEGAGALEWRQKLRDGENISEAAKNYTSTKFLAQVVLSNAKAEVEPKLETHIFVKEKQAAIDKYKSIASEAVAYVLDLEHNPELEDIGLGFMQGDIQDYGFEKDGTPNQEGFASIMNFVSNVDSMAKEKVLEMHEELGTVNFGLYDKKALSGIYDILENPVRYRESGVRVLIRGKEGDYNNAFGSITGREQRRLLVFEVGELDDLNKVNATLDKLSVGVVKLTFAGHGGVDGLHLSKKALLARDRHTVDIPSVRKLIERVQVDENGQRHIALNSCSQGRKYDAEGSMAEVFANAFDGTVVAAAPRVSYTEPHPVNHWEYTVRTNRHYELAEWLKRHPKIPLNGRVATFLLDPKRGKTGVVRVSNGKTVFDKSGSMTI